MRFFAAAVCLLLAGSVVSAATLVEVGNGGMLNGSAPGTVPAELMVGNRVTGPAVIRSAAGDELTVPAGAVVEVVVPGNFTQPEDAPPMEHFLLVEGALLGDLTYGTTIILPNGCYFTGPKDAKASVYVEKISSSHGFFRVNEGRALVAYKEIFTGVLLERQGIELYQLDSGPDDLGFRTHQSNVGDAALFVQPGRVVMELGLPKATSGTVTQTSDPSGFTKVESDASSWQGGKIGIKTHPIDNLDEDLQTGQLGPSTYAMINNDTGEIQFGFVEVDFEIVERAISLTSEFSVLAVSNFFGLK